MATNGYKLVQANHKRVYLVVVRQTTVNNITKIITVLVHFQLRVQHHIQHHIQLHLHITVIATVITRTSVINNLNNKIIMLDQWQLSLRQLQDKTVFHLGVELQVVLDL
jgi:hypothetical protein